MNNVNNTLRVVREKGLEKKLGLQQISSVGTTDFVTTDFNPLEMEKQKFKIQQISSVGTTHFVTTDFNPLEMKREIKN